ncbi:MAG: beta-propeller fold lactonase family protein [Chloroflexi bacterium]|nr:beta-propeller fold lactonase family protein [Chloroflexota bacterium]
MNCRMVVIIVACWLVAGCSPATKPVVPAVPKGVTPQAAQSLSPGQPPASTRTNSPRALSSAAPTSTLPSVSLPVVTDRIALWNLPERGRHPYAMELMGSGLYVLNTETNNIAIVDNDKVAGYIPVGKQPVALAADPTSNLLYVASNDTGSISIITNDHVVRTRNVGEAIRSLLFFDGRLFVGLDSKGTILVLDPMNLETGSTIHLPNAFSIINLAGDIVHHRLYANLYDRTAVIDSQDLHLTALLPVTGGYYTLAADPASDAILTSTYESASSVQYLTAIDPKTGAIRSRAKIGQDPAGVVVNSDGSRAYVANSYSNDVTIIDPREMTVIRTIRIDMAPRALALDEKAHRLYVGNSDSDNITVVGTDLNEVQAVIPLAMMPTAIVANPASGRVYVANASTDSVYVLEGARLVKEIPVGHHPRDLARDDRSNRLFVANAADGTVSVIDETNFNVTTTAPITQPLTTVAVDPVHARLFAGGVILGLNDLKPLGSLVLQGMTLNSGNPPLMVRINPNIDRLYVMASNGVPGSNSRYQTYSVDGATLKQRSGLAQSGNTTAMEIDPEANREFNAATHPLAHTDELDVFDATDARVLSLALPARTIGMVYNPQTHHLFLSHATSYARGYGPTPVPADDMIQVLDGTFFGEVGRLRVPFPGQMTRLGNTIYVVGREDGVVSLIQDLVVRTPPSPTPTLTPTPWPTMPPGIYTATFPILTPTSRPTGTPTLSPQVTCRFPVGPAVSSRWNRVLASHLGCPLAPESHANFAMRPFERGTMYYRADAKSILILFGDKTWLAFNDTWEDSQPADSCPGIFVPPGLAKPTRGFGKVWCAQEGVRTKIGAATGDEVGLYDAPLQLFERGVVMTGAKSTPVIIMYNDGHWE